MDSLLKSTRPFSTVLQLEVLSVSLYEIKIWDKMRKIMNIHLQNRVEKQFWLFTFVCGPIWPSDIAVPDPVSTLRGHSVASWTDCAVSWALFLGQVNYAVGLELLGLLNVLLCLLTTHRFLFQYWLFTVLIIVIGCSHPEITPLGIISTRFLITFHYLQFLIFIVIQYRPSNTNPAKYHNYCKV